MTAQELLIKAEKYLTMLDSDEQRADPEYQAFRRELHNYNEGATITITMQADVHVRMVYAPYAINYGQGHYVNDAYGTHTIRIVSGELSFWYSYRTLVAFKSPTTGLVVRKNEWGPTTGKHLKWIDGGDFDHHRVDLTEFNRKLHIALRNTPEPTSTMTIGNRTAIWPNWTDTH